MELHFQIQLENKDRAIELIQKKEFDIAKKLMILESNLFHFSTFGKFNNGKITISLRNHQPLRTSDQRPET